MGWGLEEQNVPKDQKCGLAREPDEYWKHYYLIRILLFGLNVDKRCGDKRGKEKFCNLSQNLNS